MCLLWDCVFGHAPQLSNPPAPSEPSTDPQGMGVTHLYGGVVGNDASVHKGASGFLSSVTCCVDLCACTPRPSCSAVTSVHVWATAYVWINLLQ